MRVFFKKMGIEKVRFKPAYNPYTEVRLFFPCAHNSF
jgi:phenylalanyl-tRNA synthetase alpha chain